VSEPTIEDRVTRLEQLVDRAVEYGRRSALGRAILRNLGVDDNA